MSWPFPDDDLKARRTKVAQAYRARLADVDAAACAELDEVMTSFGQQWVYDGIPFYEDDELLTLDEAAEWADVTRNAVQKWIARGHVKRRMNADLQVSVLMADLITYTKKRAS